MFGALSNPEGLPYNSMNPTNPMNILNPPLPPFDKGGVGGFERGKPEIYPSRKGM